MAAALIPFTETIGSMVTVADLAMEALPDLMEHAAVMVEAAAFTEALDTEVSVMA